MSWQIQIKKSQKRLLYGWLYFLYYSPGPLMLWTIEVSLTMCLYICKNFILLIDICNQHTSSRSWLIYNIKMLLLHSLFFQRLFCICIFSIHFAISTKYLDSRYKHQNHGNSLYSLFPTSPIYSLLPLTRHRHLHLHHHQ